MIDVPQGLKVLSEHIPIYIVGGYVRNSLSNRLPTDMDICGPLTHDKFTLPACFKIIPVNERLGTVVIAYKEDRYEYTPFRIENYPEGGGHSPREIYYTDDIYLDSLRRDFTIGAVYYDIKKDELIDFHGGKEDIRHGIIRAVDCPERVFSSDGLRIMRMARQAAELGFTIEDKTFLSAKKMINQLADISKERIRNELDRILIADLKYGNKEGHYQGVCYLKELSAFQYIIPELGDSEGVLQNPIYHKYDVLDHSLYCVLYSPPSIRLAALMHDVGKKTSLDRTSKFHMHVELGEEITRRALGQNGLKYPANVVSRTARLVANHMYNRDGKTRKNKMRRFVAENFDILDDLVALIQADSKAKGVENTDNFAHTFLETREEMQRIGLPFSIKELKINGSDLISLGFNGQEIGKTLEALFHSCLCQTLKNTHDALINEARKLNVN